jgi:hypothetical protein
MLKKTMKYTDYNGEEKEQDFYFNLNKAELIEMELSAEGGLEATVKRLMDEKDGRNIVDMFKKLILQSYGEKTVDGRFAKSPELSKKFSETAAYPELFTELATDAEAASAFVNGIVPKE